MSAGPREPAGPLPGLGMEHPLLELAWRTARAAGVLLLDGRTRALTVTTKSTRTDVVTQMDTAAEALVVESIRARRPDDGLLGEEGADRRGTSGVRWIVVDRREMSAEDLALLNRLTRHQFEIVFDREDIVVAKRVHPPPGTRSG